jgi:hypothetical protein
MCKLLESVALRLCDMIVAFNEIDKSKVKDDLRAVDGDDVKRGANILRAASSTVEVTPYNTLLVYFSQYLCGLIDDYCKIDQTNTREAFLGVGKGDLEIASYQLRAVAVTTQNIIYG